MTFAPQRKGKREHYVPGRLRVVLDLELAEPGAGLANQLYGLVAMLALGLETGCEIVLPPAHRRNGTYAIRCAGFLDARWSAARRLVFRHRDCLRCCAAAGAPSRLCLRCQAQRPGRPGVLEGLCGRVRP